MHGQEHRTGGVARVGRHREARQSRSGCRHDRAQSHSPRASVSRRPQTHGHGRYAVADHCRVDRGTRTQACWPCQTGSPSEASPRPGTRQRSQRSALAAPGPRSPGGHRPCSTHENAAGASADVVGRHCRSPCKRAPGAGQAQVAPVAAAGTQGAHPLAVGRGRGLAQAGQLAFELFEHLGAVLALAGRLLRVVAHHVAPAPLSVPDPHLLGLKGVGHRVVASPGRLTTSVSTSPPRCTGMHTM